MPDKLSKYKAKRDPSKTPEPFSGSKKDSVFSTRLFLKHFKIQVQCYGAARPGPKSGQEKK